jgi:hypothetical protein
MSMILSVRRHSGLFSPTLGLLVLLTLGGCGGSGSTPDDQVAPAPGEGTTAAAEPAHDPDDVPITEADVERPVDYATAVIRIEATAIRFATISPPASQPRPTEPWMNWTSFSIGCRRSPGTAVSPGSNGRR